MLRDNQAEVAAKQYESTQATRPVLLGPICSRNTYNLLIALLFYFVVQNSNKHSELSEANMLEDLSYLSAHQQLYKNSQMYLETHPLHPPYSLKIAYNKHKSFLNIAYIFPKKRIRFHDSFSKAI
jgi:hypothetical protein